MCISHMLVGKHMRYTLIDSVTNVSISCEIRMDLSDPSSDRSRLCSQVHFFPPLWPRKSHPDSELGLLEAPWETVGASWRSSRRPATTCQSHLEFLSHSWSYHPLSCWTACAQVRHCLYAAFSGAVSMVLVKNVTKMSILVILGTFPMTFFTRTHTDFANK